jgi:hypothetical protein
VIAPKIQAEGQRPECESVRGEWGGICPDCGQRLPSLPGPLHSRKPAINGRPPRRGAFGINR